MVADPAILRRVEAAVRALTTATRTLRLYPPTSPIPRQSAAEAINSLSELLATEPVVPLTVAREGFTFAGMPIASTGSAELADLLVAHGVAELDILPGCTEEDLVKALTLALESPDALRERGGFGAALSLQGVETIRVSDVSLTVMDLDALTPDGDVDEFLRQLATDPDKLSLWLQSVVQGDPSALGEGLSEIMAAAGAGDMQRLIDSLSTAFLSQDSGGRDAILGLAASGGQGLESLMAGVFGSMNSTDVASSLVGGLYGENMLSMSSMLTNLPIGRRLDGILAEVRPMLAQAGHTAKELSFLEHMLEVRAASEPERPLVERAPDYTRIAEIANVNASELAAVRQEVQGSLSRVNSRTVATMMSLLDQQEDFDLYCKTLDGLVSVVPTLIEQRDLDLAHRVIGDLLARESRTDLAWPELADKLHAALGSATDRRSMGALLHAVIDNPSAATVARDIVLKCGEQSQTALLEEALSVREQNGLEPVERMMGRRLVDMLIAFAPRAQWFQLATVVERLTAETDPRSMQALEGLVRRGDAQSRREVARGLGASKAPGALKLLTTLCRDANAEVAISAIRAVGATSVPGAATILDKLLAEKDIDGKDFEVAREIIGALARSVDPAASSVLSKLAGRKALIKRGHFAEISAFAQQALDSRKKGGAR